MNCSQHADPQRSASAKSAPIVLEAKALKQVAGGVVKVPDPGWIVSPGGQAPGIKVGDPGW